MGSKRHRKITEKREAGGYVALGSHFLRSRTCATLGSLASKLLLDLLSQYNGTNNGDLCATWTLMKDRGWRSKSSLEKALRELLQKGVIEKSRQGGRHKASLYALTMFAIDECKGKLDIAATSRPRSLWRENEPRYLALVKSEGLTRLAG